MDIQSCQVWGWILKYLPRKAGWKELVTGVDWSLLAPNICRSSSWTWNAQNVFVYLSRSAYKGALDSPYKRGQWFGHENEPSGMGARTSRRVTGWDNSSGVSLGVRSIGIALKCPISSQYSQSIDQWSVLCVRVTSVKAPSWPHILVWLFSVTNWYQPKWAKNHRINLPGICLGTRFCSIDTVIKQLQSKV